MILVSCGIGRHDTGPPYSRIVLAAIPLRGFGSAKTRLADSLSPAGRGSSRTAVAERVTSACSGAGWSVAVVSAPADVMAWCTARRDRPYPGQAVDSMRRECRHRPRRGATRGRWCRSDLLCSHLPTSKGVAKQWQVGLTVLAPSATAAPATSSQAPDICIRLWARFVRQAVFAHGEPHPFVLIRTGLAVELDTPADLSAVRHHPREPGSTSSYPDRMSTMWLLWFGNRRHRPMGPSPAVAHTVVVADTRGRGRDNRRRIAGAAAWPRRHR